MVWLASVQPLTARSLANPQEPDPHLGYHRIELIPTSAPVCGRFSLPHVAYVGSHEGCGCGFNSDDMQWQGFERVDEVLPLLGAMNSDEQEEFAAEQTSRALLRKIIIGALENGPVEIFGCWDGDQVDNVVADEVVDPDYFVTYNAPIVERTRFRINSES